MPEADKVEEKAEEKVEKSLKEALMPWVVKALLIAASAVGTGTYTYTTNKSEADAGYQVLVQSVKELQDTVVELQKEVSYMKGRMDGYRSAGAARAPEMPFGEPSTRQFKQLPKNLDEAVQAEAK